MTLVELLVVIAIVGLLIAMLLPAVQAARESARRATCLSNMKQLSFASQNYHGVHTKFPVGGRIFTLVGTRPVDGTNLWVELLPYIEQDNLHRNWDYSDMRNNVVGGINATQAQVIEILLCPSDLLPSRVVHITAQRTVYPPWSQGFYGMSSYGGSAGTRSIWWGAEPDYPGISRDGIFFLDSRVSNKDVVDGTSTTLLFGERFHHDPEFDRRQPVVHAGAPLMPEMGHWGFVAGPGVMLNTLHTPVTINYQMPPNGDSAALNDRTCAIGSGHAGGANFAFADGSARFVAEDLPLEQLQALSTRDGEEVVAGP
jgi:prepilin-type processing-associated H-X9-DG protein